MPLNNVSDSNAIWRNPEKPIPVRVRDLMGQLSESQKISFLNWLTPGMTNLGIPSYQLGDECLHGLVRPGVNTVFPQAIGLGATFDPEGIHAMSTAISDEARAHWNMTNGVFATFSYPLTLWSPVVNMARDPRWGRTQETYGEDPWLTSRLGVAFVRGLQGNDPTYLKTVATPKHFAANNQEAGRFACNISCDERFLFEYELFPFRACVEEGKAASIMASYTSINGVPSVSNAFLLKEVLRKRWGFNGFVVSDCGAISNQVDKKHFVKTPEEGIAASLNAGLDEEGGWFCKYRDMVNVFLPGALKQGLVSWETVNLALERILTVRFRLGLYDPPEQLPWSKIPPSVISSPEHVALARKLAGESIVLLRNAPLDVNAGNPLLPVDPTHVNKIVVAGPNANVMQYGDYSGYPKNPVNPFEGINGRANKDRIAVTLLPWISSLLHVIPPDVLSPASTNASATGLSGEYFASTDLTGEAKARRIDQSLNFDWAHIEPDPLASDKFFSVRWSGSLNTSAPGTYTFSIKADGGYRLFLDGKKVIDRWGKKYGRREETSTTLNQVAAGRHTVRIEYHHDGGETGLVFSWSQPATEDYYNQFKGADLVVLVMGLSTHYEIEGTDRITLSLPLEQEEFLRRVLASNPRTVAVFESGSPLAMPWVASNIPSILEAWYPGQEGGNAIADILFGDVNPSGRLPLTFYASDAQLRPLDEYDLTRGRTYMYLREKPEYPFGYGLSYTSFSYANPRLSRAAVQVGDKLECSVEVTNSGARDGEEVVQFYVHSPASKVPMPIRQLWGFQRVFIPKGKTRTVTIPLDSSNFGYWDKASQTFRISAGIYELQVGASSSDIRCKQSVNITSDGAKP